jgi:kynurenine 3-monooxygenase
LVATDGGKSVIRKQLTVQGLLQSAEKEIPDDYKTIFLKRQSDDSTVKLDDDKLHGWMFQKQSIKIIAAPVVAGCVSGALIFDKGRDPFREMKSSEDVYEWFQQIDRSSALSKLISNKEAAQLLARPVSTTLSVRCNRLNAGNQVLLLGDSAHSMSASVGQGCNSALQDVDVFINILKQNKNDWNISLDQYTTERIEDVHAVSDLSDYSTPRTKWMKIEWILRTILKKILPAWMSTLLLKPLPMELLMETSMPYREVLAQTQWWVDRVKNTYPEATVDDPKDKTCNRNPFHDV